MEQGSRDPAGYPETEPLLATQDNSGPGEGENILPGTRYQLQRLLGDGGAGQVYQGLHLELDKTVAIKVLHSQVSHSDEYASRFRREAKAASRISHPGVVGVTDFGTADDGRLFLVMELIEGQTLAEAIQRGPFGTSRALRVAANLCDVLVAIHASGIVHRDIKPANIFLLDDDHVKVVDFGIARVGALGTADWRITQTGKVVGTPGYMAPEHARAQEVDGRADLYSVGAVLYEMLTGVAPFRGASPVDVLMAQMVQRPDPPSKVVRRNQRVGTPEGHGVERVPRVLDRTVRRLLAVTPDDRYPDASVVASLLRDILDHLRSATDQGSAFWAFFGGRRRGVTLISATIVAVGLFAGVAVGFWALGSFNGQQTETTPGSQKLHATSIVPSPRPQNNVAPAMDAAPEVERDAEASSENVPPLIAATVDDPLSHREHPLPRTAPAKARSGKTISASATSAEEEISEAKQSSAESPQELLQRARIAAASRRFAEAERLFEQAQNGGAERGAVLSGLGQVALARGQHVRATRLLEQSLALRPGSARLRLDLGRAYRGAGQTSRAIEQWRAVLQQDPENSQAQRLLRAAGAGLE